MSSSKKQAKDSTPVGTIDLTAAHALLQEEALSKLAQAMRRDGRPPDIIMDALRDKNQAYLTPLAEEELNALVEEYRNGYVPHLTKVPMRGFMGTKYPPPRFVVDPLIPSNEVTLVSGHGGSGKSFLLLAIGAHVASGEFWDRFDVTQCPVVFVSLEDQGDHVMHRLQKIVSTCLLDAGAVEENLQVFDCASHPELMEDVNEFGTHGLRPTQTMLELEAAAAGAGLIIIDNASERASPEHQHRYQARQCRRRRQRRLR